MFLIIPFFINLIFYNLDLQKFIPLSHEIIISEYYQDPPPSAVAVICQIICKSNRNRIVNMASSQIIYVDVLVWVQLPEDL